MKSAFKTIAMTCMVLLCTASLSITAFAASNVITITLGPGDHYDEMGNLVSLNGDIMVSADGTISDIPGNPYAEKLLKTPGAVDSGSGKRLNYYTEQTADGKTVYVFEGKKYIVDSYIKNFKLTGYDRKSAGGDLTRSGKHATARHTIAAMSSLLNSVILVQGTSGPKNGQYDGIYVAEDTGGSKIESGERLDIWFDSYKEAVGVTEKGWNCADAWTLVPLE